MNVPDVIVVGAGPNGLVAAIVAAQAGRRVLLLEAAESIGGGVRSGAITRPGFTHDLCSAVYPLGIASPVFRSLDLSRFGLEWVHPAAPLAHPLDNGTAAVLDRSLEATAASLGRDGAAYGALFGPLVRDCERLLEDILAPLRVPRHPLLLAQWMTRAVRSASGLAEANFQTAQARALFAGLAAHSFRPLDSFGTAAFGLLLGMLGHAVGWPIVRGGAGRLAEALMACLTSLGGTVRTGWRVDSLEALPAAGTVLLNVTPRQALAIAGPRLPAGYARRLAQYRYGPAAFKVDWALDAPIPWAAAECGRAGTVHVGGTLEAIASAEAAVARGETPERPFVLVAQPSRFDPSRAPAGGHTAWAYCHVPQGCAVDMTDRVEAQVERFAPGFRARILDRCVTAPAELEAYNANYVGGDIGGGAQDPWQLLARPVLRWNPYATPVSGLYLCSASTPPGAGVHGMCGYHAARAALRADAGRR